MPNAPELSEAKRALLEKYMRGQMGKTLAPADSAGESATLSPQSLPQELETQKSEPEPAQTEEKVRASVVPLQPKGSKLPLFYFHVHWMGGAFYCFHMAHDLGDDQPFYVCEPYNIEGLSMGELPTLEEMAAEYLATMRRVQPEGPYLMAGFCGGALIAFEIARQLQAKGEAADLVVLIEPRAGPAPGRLIGPKIFGGLIRSVGKIMRLSPDRQFNLFLRLRHTYLFLRYMKAYREEQHFTFYPKIELLHKDWMAKFVWTISKYNPDTYQGKATYFWAEERPGQRRMGWGKGSKATEYDIHIIPGTHDTCRTDHLTEMTAQLKTCLERV